MAAARSWTAAAERVTVAVGFVDAVVVVVPLGGGFTDPVPAGFVGGTYGVVVYLLGM